MSEDTAVEYPELHWTADRVRRYWDHASATTQHYFTEANGPGILRRVKRHLRGCEGVLDYGCGSGGLVRHLLDRGYTTTAADFSKESVARVATRFAGQGRFAGAFRLEELLRGDQRFDAVFACEVIEHLYDEVLDETLKNLRSLVRAEGIIILTTPNEENLRKEQLLCPGCEHVFHRWQHVRTWSASTLRRHLEERGLDVTDVFATDFRLAFWRSNPSKWDAIRKRIQYLRKPGKRRPHLVAVCRPR